MGRARDDSARTRSGGRREEGCRRVDGHQPARPELLPGEVPHRLTTPHEVSTPVADYRAGNRNEPEHRKVLQFLKLSHRTISGISLAHMRTDRSMSMIQQR